MWGGSPRALVLWWGTWALGVGKWELHFPQGNCVPDEMGRFRGSQRGRSNMVFQAWAFWGQGTIRFVGLKGWWA